MSPRKVLDRRPRDRVDDDMSGTTRSADGPVVPEVVRPLSVEDLTILGLETETVAGHTCKIILLEDEIDVGRLRSSVAARLDHALPLRMGLCETEGDPCWVLEPELDLDQHVVAYDEPGPIDMAGLRATVAHLFEQRLDRSRPLWRIDVVPSLAGGGSALIWRIHHALADGTTAMRMADAALWDSSAGARPAALSCQSEEADEPGGAPPLRRPACRDAGGAPSMATVPVQRPHRCEAVGGVHDGRARRTAQRSAGDRRRDAKRRRPGRRRRAGCGAGSRTVTATSARSASRCR